MQVSIKNNETTLENKKILSEAKEGEKVRILRYHNNLESRTLLIGMGILPGDELEVITRSVFGSPIYLKHSRSNFFALRKNQAKFIEIE